MAKVKKAKIKGSMNYLSANGGGLNRERKLLRKGRLFNSILSEQSKLIHSAEVILYFALSAVEPAKLVNQSLKREGSRLEIQGIKERVIIDLDSYHRVFMIAMGKAALLWLRPS